MSRSRERKAREWNIRFQIADCRFHIEEVTENR
jgi:hypothetical protein